MNIFKTIFLIFFLLIFYKNTITKENFMLIQSTTSTRDSGFYEFILSEYKNDVRKSQVSGFYRDVELEVVNKQDSIQEKYDKIDGVTPNDNQYDDSDIEILNI